MQPRSPRFRYGYFGGVAVVLTACSAAPAADSPQPTLRDVASAAELARVLANPAPGTVIRLAPGDYGRVIVSRKSTPKALDAGLTLVSAYPRNPARLAELAINGASKLTVRDVAVGCSAVIQPCAMYLVSAINTNGITFEGVRVSGVGGMERGRQYGFFIRGSENVSVSGSTVTATRYGIGMLSNRAVKIVGNEFDGLQTDGIRGGGVSDLLIAENVLANFTPKEKEHPDGIQLWSSNKGEPGERITIRDNLVVRGTGGIVQGIFVRDTRLNQPFRAIRIAGNLTIGTMYNGISIAGVQGGELTDNIVLAYPDMRSYIVVRNSASVQLTGNRAMLFLFPDRRPAQMSGNKQVSPRRNGDVSAIGEWLQARPELTARAGPLLRNLRDQAASGGRSGR